MKTFILCLFAVSIGCATLGDFNKLKVGMSKEEVIKALGTPDSVSATSGVEMLNYHYRPFGGSPWGEDHYVRLKEGIVDAYGKAGDWDGWKNPTVDINVNQRTAP